MKGTIQDLSKTLDSVRLGTFKDILWLNLLEIGSMYPKIKINKNTNAIDQFAETLFFW